jgi:hypothetical protein
VTHSIKVMKRFYNNVFFYSLEFSVSRIALVKPDKARGVEDVLLRAAQSGGISEKVLEEGSIIFAVSRDSYEG